MVINEWVCHSIEITTIYTIANKHVKYNNILTGLT